MNNTKTLGQAAFTPDELHFVYNSVFRNCTEQTGFYFRDFGSDMDSSTFRKLMVHLKEGLADLCIRHLNRKLLYKSVGRFNHQHSSRPHRDTAEAHSFLMLGYEPTAVESKVFVTDYSRYIEVENIPLKDFFGGDLESNLVEDIAPLMPYVTQLQPFNKTNYRLLFVNNSKSFEEKTFGVFHGAEIPEIMEGENRIINYMMLQLTDRGSSEAYNETDITRFILTNKIDK